MNKFLNKLIMYHQIHKMDREGFSLSKISRELVIDRRTVKFYLSMSESQYEQFLTEHVEKKRELDPYESFVKCRLETYQETSAAQMHDWLKEHYPKFPGVTSKTVYNFVMWVRQKHHLPKTCPSRDYEAVEELPYGQQAQVDFGEYNLRNSLRKRIKVWFFTMVLSRSRYKYVFFSETPFTSFSAIEAHEKAFAFFWGITKEIVYDQDKVFLSDENKGDLLLTNAFKDYCRERTFRLYFCRKADPESKGKVENVVKYVKQNFLYNRPFTDVALLNSESLAWLSRTANALVHAGTHKIPYDEWCTERGSLVPFIAIPMHPPSILYTVRKDNTISWKGNFYTLPSGTYKGRGTQVNVSKDNAYIVISDRADKHLCTQTISAGKGNLVRNTDHKREKSAGIAQMITDISCLFSNPELATSYMEDIRAEKPRYVRDQLILLKQTIESTDTQTIDHTLQYCLRMKVFSANDFKSVATGFLQKKSLENATPFTAPINPLNGQSPSAAYCQPMQSAIADYELLMQREI
ncbi:MAG: IS21 family transposase [Actinobacteria bacterium]|nr:IS21 family transposase [Actinomycetota bacterium]MBE3120808.1 IS21 family transposase [Thermoplasmata archaeon]